MRLISTCPICNKKNVSELNHSKLGNTRYITLNCGHTYTEKVIAESTTTEVILADNRKLYPFQNDGVKFIERSNFRCQISDEMGLGKTIQAIGAINLHYDELKPILIVVKASLTFNWLREVVKGSGKFAQIFESGDNLLPNIGIVIVSYDTLIPRKTKSGVNDYNFKTLQGFKPKTVILDEVQMIKNHDAKRTNAIRDLVRTKVDYIPPVPQPLKRKCMETIANDLISYHGLSNRFKLEFKKLRPGVLGLTECRAEKDGIIAGVISIDTIHAENDKESDVIETILHEIAHAITPGVGHKLIWSECAKSIGSRGEQYAWCNGTKDLSMPEKENMVKHIISLSGTPIKNNAIEYFPILNLLRPEMFPSLSLFENQWVDYYWAGSSMKPGGIKYYKEFLEKTKDFIIRRTRDEVLPDLPKITRDFKYYKMGDIVRKEYSKRVRSLDNFLNDTDNHGTSFATDLISYLSILRHITGLAKIEPTVEYIKDFIENGGTKITLFHHHIDVGDVLVAKLNEAGIKNIRIVSADVSEVRLDKIETFRNSTEPTVLIAPTLACGEGINLQFCSNAILLEREWNPANEEQVEGRFSRIGAVSSAIDMCYPTAIETIDEYFAEIVERKRSLVTQSLDGIASQWDQSSIMLELANIVVKKWTY